MIRHTFVTFTVNQSHGGHLDNLSIYDIIDSIYHDIRIGEMARVIKVSFITGVILYIASVFLFAIPPSEPINAEDLVDQFSAGTSVQQQEINKFCRGKIVFASGRVSDVKERFFLDEHSGEQAETHYYVVITGLQKTPKGAIYNVIFWYKNLEDVKDFYKGQKIEKKGKLSKIFKEGVGGVWITVRLYAEGNAAK